MADTGWLGLSIGSKNEVLVDDDSQLLVLLVSIRSLVGQTGRQRRPRAGPKRR